MVRRAASGAAKRSDGNGTRRRQGKRGDRHIGRLLAGQAGNVRGRLQATGLASDRAMPRSGRLSMAAMNMIQALNSALDVMLTRDPDVLIFGEDVGYFGGVFRVTDGLMTKHGLTRCFDPPISEG